MPMWIFCIVLKTGFNLFITPTPNPPQSNHQKIVWCWLKNLKLLYWCRGTKKEKTSMAYFYFWAINIVIQSGDFEPETEGTLSTCIWESALDHSATTACPEQNMACLCLKCNVEKLTWTKKHKNIKYVLSK